MNCATCGQEKYRNHEADPPNASLPDAPVACTGYAPVYPCENCGLDCERHEPAAPHVLLTVPGGQTHCSGVSLPANWPEHGAPPFEGGGGSSGGGGASGTW